MFPNPVLRNPQTVRVVSPFQHLKQKRGLPEGPKDLVRKQHWSRLCCWLKRLSSVGTEICNAAAPYSTRDCTVTVWTFGFIKAMKLDWSSEEFSPHKESKVSKAHEMFECFPMVIKHITIKNNNCVIFIRYTS